MKRSVLALPFVVAGVLAGVVAATAQTAPPMSADSVIAGRQAGYELLQAEMQALKVVVDQGLDTKPYVDGIRAIQNWGRTVPVLFPDGTQSGHNTKARPEIWSDRAGFETAATNFTNAADRLAQLASAGDKDGFKAQYQALGGTCGACHRAYRAR